MKHIQYQEEYDYERLREERRYGLYWYSWLWGILRPVVLIVCVLLIVAGVLSATWGYIDRHYVGPVDASNEAPVTF